MRTRRFTGRITAGREAPIEVTADFVYIRLHGPGGADQESNDDAALATWTERLHDWSRRGLNVYCYFDNEPERLCAPRMRCG